MRFVFYAAVLLVVLGNVMFGLDFVSAPMSAMPENQAVIADALAAQAKAQAEAQARAQAQQAEAQAKAEALAKAQAAIQAPANNAGAPLGPGAPNPAATFRAPLAPVAPTPPQPKCDVSACAAAYRTFRASDCTYVPSFGERRLCTKGVVPVEAAATPDAPAAIANPEPDADVPAALCNVSACAAAFHSFTASDCTYQPIDGPRRLCTK